MRLTEVPNAARMLAIGLIGALLAMLVGLPMPFLIGALSSVGAYSAWRTQLGRPAATFPTSLRMLFVAVIGVMIGASFTADLLARLPQVWPSMLAMVVFVVAALLMGFALFRQVGGFDRPTSFYCAMPGGLIEAVSLGEAAGGDVKRLTLQHFARVVMVVVLVPLLYLYWSGEAVGSAGGQSFEAGPWGALDVVELLVLAAAGIWLGPKLRLPAAHLVGPLLLSAGLHAAGLLSVSSPAWLLATAQLIVGTGLGTSFAGAQLSDLGRAFALALVYVGAVLAMGYGFALVLLQITPFDFDTLFVSFAPGGVTEMGLIALSLGISPVIVTVHHVFRIGLTVAIAALTVGRV